MSIEDLRREANAEKLEGLVKSGDNNTLQDQLVKLAHEDPQGFNKTIDLLKQKNDQDRAADPHLPAIEIHKENLGFGGVEQIVVTDKDGAKTEVFETEQHYQRELEDDRNTIIRSAKNLFSAFAKWTDKPDYQKDSSQRAFQTQDSIEYPSGDKVRDFRQDDGQTRTDLSPDELQRRINQGNY